MKIFDCRRQRHLLAVLARSVEKSEELPTRQSTIMQLICFRYRERKNPEKQFQTSNITFI